MLQYFDSLKSSKENDRLDALTSIVGDCKNAGTNKEVQAWKSFEYAVGRFVKGLQSQVTSTRLEFYSGLTTLLSLAVKVDTEAVLEIIDKSLKGSGEESKSERKLLKIARILSYGALIRAKCKSDPNGSLPVHIARRILKSIVDITVKKKSLRSLSTPFICTFLNMCPPGELDEGVLSDLQRLLSKQEEQEDLDLNYFKIVLTAEHRNLTPALGMTREVHEIIKVLLAETDADDSDFLSLVFHHIRNSNLFEAFWKIFVSSLGPYHTELFCTCITHSIKSGCPLSYILCEDVVHLALSIFNNQQLGKTAKDKALESFQAIVSWGEGCCLTSKERKSALKLLYKKKPNLLYDYKILVGVIRNHLQHLSNKELDYLGGFLLESARSETEGESARVRISTIDLLRSISQMKKSSSSGNIEIANLFFQLGFCKQNISKEEGKAIDENSGVLVGHCSSLFLKCHQKTTDHIFVSAVYDYVSSVVDSTEGTYELLSPLDGQAKALWDKTAKLLKKITDPVVKLISQVGAVQLVKTSEDFLSVFENWLDLAKKIATKESPQEIVVFIVDQIASLNQPFCDFEAIFKRFAMEGKIVEETVQSLADAIDISEDFDDDEDDDSDEDESEDDEVVQNTTLNGFSNNQMLSNSNVPADEINGGSDSDATIDMDEATEEDLKRMDDALAGVFSAKKRVKEDARRETIKYMRVLNLVDVLIGRYKEPPISVILILLMPLISSVKHNLSIKSNKSELSRTLATLKRLNKCRKFTGMEDVDSDVLSTMAKEIEDLMKKKVVPKDVKNILASSRNNLLSSCQGSEKEEKTGKKDKKKKKKKAKTSNPSQPSTVNPSATTSEDSLETKNLKKAKTSSESAQVLGTNLPSKRKARAGSMKKKAKLLRMEVLSEGLSLNE